MKKCALTVQESITHLKLTLISSWLDKSILQMVQCNSLDQCDQVGAPHGQVIVILMKKNPSCDKRILTSC